MTCVYFYPVKIALIENKKNRGCDSTYPKKYGRNLLMTKPKTNTNSRMLIKWARIYKKKYPADRLGSILDLNPR
jgi:hypothetical protein